MKKDPKIFICVKGGLIQSIITDKPVKIMVLDCDTDGLNDEEYEDVDGSKFKAVETYDSVDVNKDIVDKFFAQKKDL